MGSPIFGTITEVFLQTLEKSVIKHLIDNRALTLYTRYVDDIFIIYDSTATNLDSILQYISNIHNNIQLNPTHETNIIIIKFLDLTITKKTNHLSINIYCKPTITDNTIHFLSNHPLNKNWQPTDSMSGESSPPSLTRISKIMNAYTYSMSPETTMSPTTYCSG
jgi:hypothetical protein